MSPTELTFPAVEDLGAVVVELRARVEALETAENDRRFKECSQIIDEAMPKPAFGASLADQVAFVIENEGTDCTFYPEAKAAISKIAEWLENYTYDDAARLLRQQLNQPTNQED